MTAVMQGVRILEVAEHTFVPAASALLADWGAEVIKVEHVERGDAMRGLASSGARHHAAATCTCCSSTRTAARRASALDLNSPDGLEVLYRLAKTCDVFLTNKLPSVRAKLKIDVEHLRAHNPKLIYVRGTGQGERGPDADRGSYDALAYWCRAGIAMSLKHADDPHVPGPPGPAFGDSIGAMTIAGGIMGALFHRERTGAAPIVDVSLLEHRPLVARRGGRALAAAPGAVGAVPADVLDPEPAGAELQDEGRALPLVLLPAGGEVLAGHHRGDRPARARRGSALRRRAEHHEELGRGGGDPPRRRSPSAPPPSGASASRRFAGQWALVQDTIEAANDPQSVANGYVVDCADLRGHALQARRRARTVRREAGRLGARARVQRARRRDPPGAGPRLGRDPRSQGARSRGVILKAGTRLKSAVCATEVMVIAAPTDDGRADAAAARRWSRSAEPGGGHDRRRPRRGGTQIGKRYVNAAGDLELLCTKPGKGSLALGGAPLALKEAKPLPSSD